MALYTSGTWVVKEGSEQASIDAWRDIAEWTSSEMTGTRWAKLMQDDENPNRFLSFGPWESAEAIQAWRESEGFQQPVGRIRELLEGFEPRTMHAVAEIGSTLPACTTGKA
jgi:quinol monooxygenase YgiN